MITYTETAFNMETRQSEPVARWTVETTAADLLTVSRNGERKTVKIVPDGSFVVALKKPISAPPVVRRAFIRRWIAGPLSPALPAGWGRSCAGRFSTASPPKSKPSKRRFTHV